VPAVVIERERMAAGNRRTVPRMRDGRGKVISSMAMVSAVPSQESELGPIASVERLRRTDALRRSVNAQRLKPSP